MANRFHIIKGSGAKLTPEGWVINQTAHFDGLTGDGTAAGLISAAYNVLVTNGYYIGKFLPFSDNSWPIVLDEMDFSTLTPDSQEVGLVWRSRRYATVRANFNTSAAMEQTNLDADGTPISVQYTYPEGHEKEGQTEITGGMVNKLIPEMAIEISRTEWGPTYGWPAGYDISAIITTRKFKYEGKINSTTWYPVPGTASIPVNMQFPGSWLCTGINATTNDTGVTYDVTYTFAFREIQSISTNKRGWDTTVVFIDPSTGRPVPNPVEGESIKKVVNYKTEDFSGIWEYV